MKLPVLAKSYSHFKAWCVRAGINPRDCDYISGLRDLRGRRFGLVIKLEGWTLNTEYTAEFQVAFNHCFESFIYADVS